MTTVLTGLAKSDRDNEMVNYNMDVEDTASAGLLEAADKSYLKLVEAAKQFLSVAQELKDCNVYLVEGWSWPEILLPLQDIVDNAQV